eukprot:jgi/Psemu1/224484/e_gw1.1486.4.1
MVLLDSLDSILTYVDVAPFSDTYSPLKNVPIARCATAWTDPTDGITYILVFGQALFFGTKLQHSLVCPNQVRDCNFNKVEDTPRRYDSNSTHGIIFQSEDTELFIPLQVKGVISYFDSCKPTKKELASCEHILATDTHTWDPYSAHFAEEEEATNASFPRVVATLSGCLPACGTPVKYSSTIHPIIFLLNPDVLDQEMSLDKKSFIWRGQWGPPIRIPDKVDRYDAKAIAKMWNISEKRAKATIEATTQDGIRQLSQPITKRLKTQKWRNRRMLKGLGIPEHLVTDGAKAQGSHETHSTGWHKLRSEYRIRQTYIQPHCSWQNTAEHSAGDLRRAIRLMTSKKGSPRRCWAFCGMLAAGRMNLVASSDPSSMGRTSFELVHGYTPDITLYMIHDWYDFIWWYDLNGKTNRLGRWLGPCGDTFGGGDCHYILFKTGKVHITNSTRAISEEEWRHPDILSQLEAHNKAINAKVGDEVKPSDTYLENELGEPPLGLFDGKYEGEDEVLMAEAEASSPDVGKWQLE